MFFNRTNEQYKEISYLICWMLRQLWYPCTSGCPKIWRQLPFPPWHHGREPNQFIFRWKKLAHPPASPRVGRIKQQQSEWIWKGKHSTGSASCRCCSSWRCSASFYWCDKCTLYLSRHFIILLCQPSKTKFLCLPLILAENQSINFKKGKYEITRATFIFPYVKVNWLISLRAILTGF